MYRLTGNVKIFGLLELDLTQRCQRCLIWKIARKESGFTFQLPSEE